MISAVSGLNLARTKSERVKQCTSEYEKQTKYHSLLNWNALPQLNLIFEQHVQERNRAVWQPMLACKTLNKTTPSYLPTKTSPSCFCYLEHAASLKLPGVAETWYKWTKMWILSEATQQITVIAKQLRKKFIPWAQLDLWVTSQDMLLCKECLARAMVDSPAEQNIYFLNTNINVTISDKVTDVIYSWG